MRPMRPRGRETSEGNKTATPLRLSILSGLSWENSILDIRVLLRRLLVHTATCFFSDDRPPEELDNKRSSTRRGEFDSSTPEAIGVSLGYIFLA